mmetsp:Transcript_9338/g.39251  ORF Transcript_9338/g.39251 Transcript_9338/m.39251 type:complete len:233 (-) Transcript_9338:276-974(-)
MPSSPASCFQNVPSLGRQNANSQDSLVSPSSSAGTRPSFVRRTGTSANSSQAPPSGGENIVDDAVSTFELLCLCHATTRRRSNLTPDTNVVTSVPVPSLRNVISLPLPNKCTRNTNRATSRSCASALARAPRGALANNAPPRFAPVSFSFSLSEGGRRFRTSPRHMASVAPRHATTSWWPPQLSAPITAAVSYVLCGCTHRNPSDHPSPSPPTPPTRGASRTSPRASRARRP